jgi:hypothetical protein
VVVSGVPQHFGFAVVSLNPWYLTDTTRVETGGNSGPTLNQLTQLPHIFVDASTSTGGELSLPLILPFNALSLRNQGDVSGCMGLHVMSYTGLQTLNPNNLPAHISVWAWLSDVILTNPTAENLPYLTAQSGDEYGKPPISKYASLVSATAGYMTTIPGIAPYARATEMLSSGIAYLAELFGYSRPNASKTELPMQHKNVGNLVHYNFEDTSTKLTLDSKAEVTIDPCIAGVHLTDEMAISSIVTREGYVGSFTWRDDNSPNDPLARMVVSPTMTRIITTTGVLPHVSGVVDMTPLGFVATAFRRWRGTLRFRFVVVCSAFHKGRIRFVFEPGVYLPILGTTEWNNEANVNQSYILDLSESKELTVLVPWASAESYLDVMPTLATTDAMYDFTNPQSLEMTQNRKAYNGVLGAHVLAPLVAPSESTTVRVLVFLSGCEDMEFQEPGNAFANYMFSGWAPQSGKEDLGSDILTGNELITDDVRPRSSDIVGTQSKAMVDKLASIHYGERIVSIRQLIKRYVHHSHTPVNNSADFGISNLISSDFPSYKGWATDADFTTGAGDKFNYARDSYLAYFSQAFLGFRGSIRQKYILNVTNDDKNYQLYATRSTADSGFSASTDINLALPNRVANMINNAHDARLGTTSVIPAFNNVIEFECPHYSPQRFFFAQWKLKYRNLPEYDIVFNNHMVTLMGKHTNTFLTRFVAAGDDYQLIFFKYAPCARNVQNPAPL